MLVEALQSFGTKHFSLVLTKPQSLSKTFLRNKGSKIQEVQQNFVRLRCAFGLEKKMQRNDIKGRSLNTG